MNATQVSDLAFARDTVHAAHSRGMPYGWVAAVDRCENSQCAAITKAIKAAKEEFSDGKE